MLFLSTAPDPIEAVSNCSEIPNSSVHKQLSYLNYKELLYSSAFCYWRRLASWLSQQFASFRVMPAAQAWDAVRVNQALQAVVVHRACWHLRRSLADVQCHATTGFALAKIQAGFGDGYFLRVVHGLILCPG